MRDAQRYIKLGKRMAPTIRRLGYPTKNALKGWYREYERRQGREGLATPDEARAVRRCRREAASVQFLSGGARCRAGELGRSWLPGCDPNRKWLTDITEFQLPAGVCYSAKGDRWSSSPSLSSEARPLPAENGDRQPFMFDFATLPPSASKTWSVPGFSAAECHPLRPMWSVAEKYPDSIIVFEGFLSGCHLPTNAPNADGVNAATIRQ